MKEIKLIKSNNIINHGYWRFGPIPNPHLLTKNLFCDNLYYL